MRNANLASPSIAQKRRIWDERADKYPGVRETRKTREETGGIFDVPLASRVFQVLRVHIYYARSPIS